MDLHRTGKQPDWQSVAIGDQNYWQRLATRSNGWATPGNVVTAFGLLLVAGGLVAIAGNHFWVGLIALVAGRLCDLLDGWIANKTGTKSPLGEALDVGVDKLGTLGTLIVFAVVQLANWWLLLVLALPHIVITIVTIYAKAKRIELHPSRLGKFSMAGTWLGLMGLAFVRAIGQYQEAGMTIAGLFILAVSVIGAWVAADYIRQL